MKELSYRTTNIFFSQEPLFGNRMRKRGNKTHWLCFMKGRESTRRHED
jgi:hypothetical protein